MENPHPESGDIAIRCPGCGQRFKVGPDLKGRMVECGTCDQRFRVEDDVTIRTRRFFPGERRDPSLERFGRVPSRAVLSADFQAQRPVPPENQRTGFEPASPFRVILGMAGVLLAVLMAAILIFGGSPGGMLDGTPTGKRLVLAGFTAVVSFILLLVANPQTRKRALAGGIAIAAGLLALPFVFTDGEQVIPRDSKVVEFDSPEPKVVEPENVRLDALRSEIGYGPMADALAEMEGDEDGRSAVGVWLRGLREFNKYQLIDFLKRKTGASEKSWMYSRPPDYLLVLWDVEPDLEAIAEFSKEFGNVVRIIGELQVIEVEVDNDVFVQGELTKLQDPGDPAFYELNRRELESIDLQRAHKAVRRLVSAEPKLFRSDIVGRLLELMEEGDDEMRRDVALTLGQWAEPGDGSVAMVRGVATEMMRTDGKVAEGIIEFLVDSEDHESLPLLHQLWKSDPREWEEHYADMGPVIEDRLLAAYDDDDATATMTHSITRMLRQVGTAKSLPKLREMGQTARNELAILIDNAIEAIERRGAG